MSIRLSPTPDDHTRSKRSNARNGKACIRPNQKNEFLDQVRQPCTRWSRHPRPGTKCVRLVGKLKGNLVAKLLHHAQDGNAQIKAEVEKSKCTGFVHYEGSRRHHLNRRGRHEEKQSIYYKNKRLAIWQVQTQRQIRGPEWQLISIRLRQQQLTSGGAPGNNPGRRQLRRGNRPDLGKDGQEQQTSLARVSPIIPTGLHGASWLSCTNVSQLGND